MLSFLAAIVVAWLTSFLISRGLAKTSSQGLILVVLMLMVLGQFVMSVASVSAAHSGVPVLQAIGPVVVWS